MKNNIKKQFRQVITYALIAGLMLRPVFLLSVNAAEKPNGLYSAGAVLMDADSGRILYGKNENELYAMASTTKIMTCILALEHGKMDQIVTFSENAAAQPDVQMNGKVGEQYYLKDLLYSTMLESHNDSAVAIAEAIGGSVEKFTNLMDKKAEAIGCVNTNFVTPNGLDGKDVEGDHCTTAKELALILRYCISISSKKDEFIKITGTPFYEFQEIHGKRMVSCRNHNALLTSYQGAFTGKTGYTGKAGYCYTGAVKKEKETMIIALLGAGSYPNKSLKWKDAKRLLDYGFENYDYQLIGKAGWKFPQVPVVEGMKEEIAIATDAKTFAYLLGKEESVKCRVEYAEQLIAPVAKHTVVGTITYELNGQIIEQFKVYTKEEIEKSTFWNILKKWLKSIQDFVENMINK